jgi:uncharacterized protein YcfL
MNRLLLTLLLGLVIGCQSVPAPVPGRADPYVPEQINITHKALRTRTAFLKPAVNRDADTDLLIVSVPARATTDQQLYIEYRTVFLDDRGIEINPNASWVRKTLAPNVWTALTANSTTPRAADFRMDIRYGRIN